MSFAEQMLDALGEVGVDLVDMAERQWFPKSFLRRTLPVAACAALMLGAGLYAWDYLHVDPVMPASVGQTEETQQANYTIQKNTTENVLLSSQSSECGSSDARNQNLALACEAIDGLILEPGAAFSFNDTVGERTEEKGYVAASTYYDGEGTSEIGGGIGQVASMLYCASLKLGLEQLERAGNTYAVTYVPLGFDAAVYWGVTDYRFCNSLDTAIEIRAYVADEQVTVELWGQPEEAQNIELECAMVGDNVVETYQVYLDENGEVLRQELITTTQYKER